MLINASASPPRDPAPSHTSSTPTPSSDYRPVYLLWPCPLPPTPLLLPTLTVSISLKLTAKPGLWLLLEPASSCWISQVVMHEFSASQQVLCIVG
uniref:Uncharacterized protein n=1 Tax=Mesocestoides corti TaxID=53468 RepID=A0A5K3FWC6_MESCO